MLEIKDVSYTVDNRTILSDINLTINKGDTIAIIGPSGSGKSTLFRLISNLISPTQGALYYQQQNYEQINPESLRMDVSYLLQQSDLFKTTIADNLAFSAQVRDEHFDKKRAKQLLKAVGLDHYKLDAKVQRLSGGERQRITIARQLMYLPKVLLLDEATSALDTQNRNRVEELIFSLAKQGVAILWITHSKDQSLRRFNKRLHLVDGHIEKEEVLR
ncbi:ABC transporter ATP-binding protein [Staphylococcus gallinarum]|uniref:ABC transporter ATP-binding protein n=1 Tax=Staphylococcus gallinarum TaxID=1293 RepID=UPI001E4A299C|nr:ATP-binding cassette domain-containing protein [Staphylococcus gallinarum]MCD8910927.1 ATP-binding cassette domain-containing protein [Staphylococcus gallinarum]MEB7039725.1 ATP-binding cassette domain-containing protein [Staphylococcus gallinarum]